LYDGEGRVALIRTLALTLIQTRTRALPAPALQPVSPNVAAGLT
jgi:hypothetical protein